MPVATAPKPKRKAQGCSANPAKRYISPGIQPPELNPDLSDIDQFHELSGKHALAHLVKRLSYPLPASVQGSVALETALEKIQARFREAHGLNNTNGPLTVNLAFLGQSVVEPKRISERITPSQVVDVEASPSDSHADAFDPGI